MNDKEIQNIFNQSKAEGWDFEKQYQALKDAGIEWYEVDVAVYRITFFGDDMSISKEPQPDFKEQKIAGSFRSDMVKSTIGAHREKGDVPEVLEAFARAGVWSYEINMSENTITYRGHGQEFKEDI